MYFYCSYW